MKRPTYTFLQFNAGQPTHAIDRHPDNIEHWLTLCGLTFHRTTGTTAPGRLGCSDCRAEVQRRGRYIVPKRTAGGGE